MSGSKAWPDPCLIGNLFDVVFKANRRNYQILKAHTVRPRQQRRLDWLFLLATGILVVLSVALPVIALIFIVKHI